jgi:hypothetical protein
MQASTSRPGHPALREGLVFGVTLWIITLPAALLPNFVPTNSLVTILGALSFLVAIALNLFAGVRASQRTGRVRTGALAGVIMGLISSLLGTITSLITFFVFDTPLHHIFSDATSAQVQQIITVWIISFVIGFVVGLPLQWAGIGAIGGLIGRRRTQLPLYV